ncbi:hydroxymethylpyrimidine/phosphomethylpyrimidine kinase [Actinomyces ruminis]|uniref:pyridoxal kinase n=1 Tax=Actinomyces ruminis TaxID=1937003 RepID=A0ABX4MD52_9ACTO|nr:hydroxymethylpyrimidine/phosphomethylpyrimidine kinase [Actinomyces ruminis]PHP53387.1 hydroxymethylpyrimidine/phosphomethylpyrimidine kinase [Actinomyces ruminis]
MASNTAPAAPPIALAIAGSEASGGAGAQTDLKTFHQLGVFGCTALTCIVSMDPKRNWDHRFVPVDPQVIADQIEACATVHTRIDAVKIGMLGTLATIDAVDAALEQYQFPNLVVDPVLICKGQEPGTTLDVDNALRAKILPRAKMATPNLFEAATLAGTDEITSVAQLKDAAKRIYDLGVPNVLAKAGPTLGTGTALDVFYDGETLEVLEVPAVGTERMHGAGCTLAAAVTAELAKGATPLEAAVTAKNVVSASVNPGMHGNIPFTYVYQGFYQADGARGRGCAR